MLFSLLIKTKKKEREVDTDKTEKLKRYFFAAQQSYHLFLFCQISVVKDRNMQKT